MPVFFCKVVDRDGRARQLFREAESEELLIGELNREAVFPVKIRVLGRERRTISRRERISRSALTEFSGSLAILLSSGLTFKDALEIAQTIFTKGAINRLVVRLLEEIRKGSNVYDAMEDLGRGIPPIVRGFVKIGEKIGSLEGAFLQLSAYLTSERQLREKLINSLMYPILVIVVAIVGVVGISVFVFPRLRSMFSEIGASLPPRFELMIRMMDRSLRAILVLLALAAVLVVTVLLIRRRGGAAAESIDRWLLRFPLVGRLRFLREILTLLFAMESLTQGGFTVEDALQEAAKVVSNRAVAAAVLRTREEILKGENLSEAFLGERLFPPRLGHWIAVGERSGQIAKVFGQLRLYYQSEIEKWTSRFMNLIEPVLILLVGIIIFLIILFFIVPIFSI